MDIRLEYNNTDITQYVIEYTRDQNICSGVGILSFLTAKNIPVTIEPWGEIELFENSRKKGTYIVATSGKSNDGKNTVQCQDYSKKLQDHFITETYESWAGANARYWIELFLNSAGLTYEFTVDNYGASLSEYTTFGLAPAYDLIMSLLTQSGWYIYFDVNGKAIIGDINTSLSNPVHTFNESEILRLDSNKNDKMLRNRAVVWGSGNPDTGEWVFADISVETQWNYDSIDKRAVVLANSGIPNYGTAAMLANKMINEFAKITFTREVDAEGEYNVKIGDIVFIQSRYGRGAGLVTSIGSEMSSSSGLVTKMILDERCPRLFGYVGYDSDYVYVGTFGKGVWRKLLLGDSWEDFSTGITDLFIKDLAIANGQFACVSYGGVLYLRDVALTSWFPVTPIIEPEYAAQACAIDQHTTDVYVLYTKGLSNPIIYKLNGDGTIISSENAVVAGHENISAFDIDIHSDKLHLTGGSQELLYRFLDDRADVGMDMFTTNELDTYTRTWQTETLESYTGNPVMMGGVVYSPEQNPEDPTEFRIVVYNHNDPETLVTTYSNYVTDDAEIGYTSFIQTFIYDEDTVYVITGLSWAARRYKYTVSTNTLELITTFNPNIGASLTAASTLYFKNIYARMEYAEGVGVYFYWFDLRTSEYGYEFISQYPIGSTIRIGSLTVTPTSIHSSVVYYFKHPKCNKDNDTCCAESEGDPLDDDNGDGCQPKFKNSEEVYCVDDTEGAGGSVIIWTDFSFDIRNHGFYIGNDFLIKGTSHSSLEAYSLRTGYSYTNYGSTSMSGMILGYLKEYGTWLEYAGPPPVENPLKACYLDDYTIEKGSLGYFENFVEDMPAVELESTASSWAWGGTPFLRFSTLLDTYSYFPGDGTSYVGLGGMPIAAKQDYKTLHWYNYLSSTGSLYRYEPDLRDGLDVSMQLVEYQGGWIQRASKILDYGENIVAIGYRWRTSLTLPYSYKTVFFEFGPYEVIGQNPYITARKELDTFYVIDTTDMPQHLELSTSFPVATYGVPISMINPSGAIIPSGFGVTVSGNDWLRVIYTTTGSGRLGVGVPGVSGVTDMRLFSLNQGLEFPVVSGWDITASGIPPETISGYGYTPSGTVHMGVYTSGIVQMQDVTPVTGEWLALFYSGGIGKFETSNTPDPYMFISTTASSVIAPGFYTMSGYAEFTPSGSSQSFYQKNPGVSGFINMSTNLPDSEITVIRLDDKI